MATTLPAPRPGDRDPWEELGVGDQTPRMLDVVEAASQGHSFALAVPPGADDTSVLASILAEFGSRGRSSMHVTSSHARARVIEARLADLGVGEMVARLDGDREAEDRARGAIASAMADTSDIVNQPAVEQMRTELRRIREALAAHITYLHRPFQRFGVSASDALQVLTDLTNQQPSPSTRVRLPEPVLIDIASDQGARARSLLDRASFLGMFTGMHTASTWDGVVINSTEQVPEVLRRLETLTQETLPELRVRMMAAQAQTEVHEAINLAEWDQHLEMYQGVREALDVFLPEVFEKSAADMIIATAPRQWRREHGVDMSRGQRKRLVKQAEDLVRPGRHVDDLHNELVLVQERREKWRQQADENGWPTLPDNLDEAIAVTARVNEDLDHLAPLMSTAYPNLKLMPLADLSTLLERLADDPDGARILPQRVAVLKELREMGLSDLAADMRERGVSQSELAPELDLAWWASVLGLMLKSEPRLGGFDPQRLEAMVVDGRRLDREQVDSLAPQAVQRLRHLRLQAMAARPDKHSQMISAVQSAKPVPALYRENSLAFHMVPVVLAPPSMVPALVDSNRKIDLLVLEDIDGVPLAELVPILARARQVIVVTNRVGGANGGNGGAAHGPLDQIAAALPATELDIPPERLNEQVARLLARHNQDAAGVPVPFTDSETAVSLVYADGTGMPAPGSAAIETSREEVAAVVDAVVEHALERPDQTLAVVALNSTHADRIRAQVATKVAGSPGLASFFDVTRPEPFTVADPTTVAGLHRDRIILAVGYAKTPHGRIIHDFGALSSSDGARVMARVLRSVRGDLVVVSSIRADEIDRARVNAEGTRMLIDVLEMAENGGDGGKGSPWPTLQSVPDQLLIDLAERLYGLGLEVVPNLGVPGGMRIPLAIGHPEVPGRLLVALLTDDEAYVAEPSQRVRDRLRPEMLEAQGWHVRTELSMAVFIDPNRETEEIVHLVLDAVDEVNGIVPPPVEVPDEVPDFDPDEDVQVVAVDGDVADRVAEGVAGASPTGQMPIIVPTGSMDAIGAAGSADSGDAAAGVDANGDPVAGTDPNGNPVAGADADTDTHVPGGTDVDPDAPHALVDPAALAGAIGHRGERPPIAKGLPLAAYADDQLDELAEWVRSDGIARSEDAMVTEMREALGLTRRGAQSEAVLRNVVRRTQG